jgi:hypothetical protein
MIQVSDNAKGAAFSRAFLRTFPLKSQRRAKGAAQHGTGIAVWFFSL